MFGQQILEELGNLDKKVSLLGDKINNMSDRLDIIADMMINDEKIVLNISEQIKMIGDLISTSTKMTENTIILSKNELEAILSGLKMNIDDLSSDIQKINGITGGNKNE